MTELIIAETKSTDCRGRVAASDNGEAVDPGQGGGNRLRSRGKWLEFEHTHRPVPEHRFGCPDDLGEPCRSVGSYVESEARFAPRAVFDRIGRTDLMLRIRTELRCDHDIRRQYDLDAQPTSLVEVAAHRPDLIALQQACTDPVPQGGQEGEEHAAADQQGVDPRQKVPDDTQLVGNLRPAEDHSVRFGGLFGEPVQHVEFRGDEEAGRAGQRLCQLVNARLLAMDYPETVGNEGVAERREALGERRPVLVALGRFPRVEAEVLEDGNVTVLQLVDPIFRGRTHGICGEGHRLTQQFTQPLRHGGKAVLCVGRAIRPAEVRDHHDARTDVDQRVERRQ